MPKLGNLLGASGVVEIPAPGDEPLRVVYRKDILTPRLQAQMAAFQGVKEGEASAVEAMDFFCSVVARMIESWNLTDDDGQVIGTDAESLKDVQLEVLTLVMTAIGRAMNPDPLSSNGSSNGSSVRADLEPLLSISG